MERMERDSCGLTIQLEGFEFATPQAALTITGTTDLTGPTMVGYSQVNLWITDVTRKTFESGKYRHR